MWRIVLVLLWSLSAIPLRAETLDAVRRQADFDRLWAALSEPMGADTALVDLTVLPDRLDVRAQAPAGGALVDAWTVQPGRLWGLNVTGPRQLQVGDVLGDARQAFWDPDEIPLDRLAAIAAAAVDTVPLTLPGRVTAVRIGRTMSILPEPSYGAVRWTITVGNGRETAEVTTDAQGRLIGADLSQTERGRNRDFLTQDGWDFGLAAEGLANLTGPGPVVWQVSLSDKTLAVEAETPESAKVLATWSWDGGRFTRGLVDSPNTYPMRHGGGLPFALADAQVARLPAVLAAARAALPHLTLRGLRAAMPRPLTGAPEVVWIAEKSTRPRRLVDPDYEAAEIWLRPDGTVVQVILPPSERPPLDLLSGDGIAAAMAAFAGVVGDGGAYEVMIRDDRAELKRPDPVDVGMDMTITFDGKGLSEGFDSPAVFFSAADMIPMARFAALDAATVEAMKARAMAEIPIPGAEVYSFRLWSGTPWWTSPDGGPMVDVRVGVPPRHDLSGYAVFTVDGTLVEVIK